MLKAINQHLDEASARLELAAREIADSQLQPVSTNLHAIGRALEQITDAKPTGLRPLRPPPVDLLSAHGGAQ